MALELGTPVSTGLTYAQGNAITAVSPLWDTLYSFGSKSKWQGQFFKHRRGENPNIPYADTNLVEAGKIPFGRAFQVASIGLSVFNRKPLAGATELDPAWLKAVQATLMNYGVISVKTLNYDVIFEKPLSAFLPTVQDASGSANFSQVAPYVFDLKDETIDLNANVNFDVNIDLDIPQMVFNGTTNTYEAITADTAKEYAGASATDFSIKTPADIGVRVYLNGALAKAQ
jgi:hypothetical protein